ncbi:MAG: thiamine diphosphokinase [Clostridia bacterium]
MKALLVLNGDNNVALPNSERYDFVVCADGAYENARHQLKKIDYVVGDFDSLKYEPKDVKIMKLVPEKDFTDGEIALQLILDNHATEIDIYWATGFRVDHFLGNLTLLKRAKEHNVNAKIISNLETITFENGYCELRGVLGKTVSLFPFSNDLHIISSSGLKYQTNDLTLSHNEARGISNVALDDVVKINADRGDYLVLISE